MDLTRNFFSYHAPRPYTQYLFSKSPKDTIALWHRLFSKKSL